MCAMHKGMYRAYAATPQYVGNTQGSGFVVICVAGEQQWQQWQGGERDGYWRAGTAVGASLTALQRKE